MRHAACRLDSCSACRQLRWRPAPRRRVSIAPLVQIALIGVAPGLTDESADALVHDRDRPSAHPQPRLLRLPAEIEIVEVEVKALVEAQRLGAQCVAVHGEEKTIEKLDRLSGRPKHIDRIQRQSTSVPDGAAQVLPEIRCQPLIDKQPSWLPDDPATVAGEPDDIEGTEALADLVRPMKVAEMQVVMHEKEHCAVSG